MPSRLNPYLQFDGNAREAMEFYRDVFGGELTLNSFADFGNDDPAIADRTMHAQLETERGFALMASDTAPGMEYRYGTNISISLSGDDAEELRAYWDALSSDGTVAVPLEKQMWGDEFGMCVDRFGIQWMVNIGQPR